MDYDVIKTVLAVARTRSFSEAAYDISCSQSSVSRRVELAENEIGIKIFIRPSESLDHSVHLTSLGERAVPIFQRLADDYRAVLSLAETVELPSTTIHVGTRGHSMPPMAFSIIKTDFYNLYPSINLDIEFNNLDKLIFDLKSRRLDALFFGCKTLNAEELQKMDNIRLRLLGRVPMSIGVSSDSHLTEKESVWMDELKDELFLLQDESIVKVPGIEVAQMSEFIERTEAVYGFTPKRQLIKENMLEIRYQLVKNGKGIFPSFTPATWRSMPGITYIPLAKQDESYINYYLLSRNNEKEKELQLFSNYLFTCISGEIYGSQRQ